MGPNHLSWIYQVSELTFVLVFCMLLLLPVSSAYSLQESDVPTYKEKRDTGVEACQIHPRNCPLFRKRSMQIESLLKPFQVLEVRDSDEDAAREVGGLQSRAVPDRFRKSLLELLNNQAYEADEK